jgi:hypothetical protein
LDPRNEPEGERVDLAGDAAGDGGVPLIVEHKCLDVGLGEVAVLLEGRQVESGLRVLGSLLGSASLLSSSITMRVASSASSSP